jgi:chemotaxis protein CheX
MRAEYINPFVSAVANTFATVVACELQRGAPRLQLPGEELFDVSGVIGLSGSAVGSVVLSVSKEVALQATSVMLMTEMTEVNADVIDAVGELTNMVAGSAKAKLAELQLSISLPTVVTGKGHVLSFPREVTPICIPFESTWGPLKVEVCLAQSLVPA